jgi:endonuclease/exonuclease/phosphatase family metal-dependent hydrolase
MVEFPKPKFAFEYNAADEIVALRDLKDRIPADLSKSRHIPPKADDRLLLATWNIANLGLQDRREQDYRIIAEMLSWFDLIALQEVNDNLIGLREIQKHLPADYRALFSESSGNTERLAFLYDTKKLKLGEKIGKITIPPSDIPDIKLPDIDRVFQGFDRAPFIATFEAGALRFAVINVHLYFGKFKNPDESKESIERRQLEAYAVARWAHLRQKSKNAYVKDILAIGDFNLPKVASDDPIYRALTRRGLKLPKHSTEMGSNLDGDFHYDQVAFFPNETEADFTGKIGVYDFDSVIFKNLWGESKEQKKKFFAYLRYYMSDHRILWAEFRL